MTNFIYSHRIASGHIPDGYRRLGCDILEDALMVATGRRPPADITSDKSDPDSAGRAIDFVLSAKAADLAGMLGLNWPAILDRLDIGPENGPSPSRPARSARSLSGPPESAAL